jgi:hypothetical protein
MSFLVPQPDEVQINYAIERSSSGIGGHVLITSAPVSATMRPGILVIAIMGLKAPRSLRHSDRDNQ